MKKTLAILTLVVMLAALIVPVAMAAVEAKATCDHPGSYIASETQVGPRFYSNTKHGYAIKRVAKCTACNETLTTSYANWTGLTDHTRSSVKRDKGHVGTSLKHTFETTCTVCGGTYTYNATCTWPCAVN